MRTYSMFQINDFSGGLNNKAAPMAVADNQAVDLLNAEFDITGALVKRKGFTAYNSTAISGCGSIENVIRYYKNDGARTFIVTATGSSYNHVFKGNDATGAFTEITGGAALTINKPIDLLVYRDTVFMSNGEQAIQYYTMGTTRASVSGTPTPPTGKYLAVCDNRLFVSGNTSAPNRIYFSGIALFSTLPAVDFPADNFIDIPKQDTGDVITGLMVFRDELFIFRRNDVWALLGSGPEDYTLQEINNRVGALGHRAIANTGNSLVFVSQGHIFEYADGVLQDIGLPVQSLIGSLNFSNVFAAYYPAKKQVWIGAGTSGAANNRVLMFDTVHRAWSVFDIGLKCACVFAGAGDGGELYGGSPAVSKAWRLDNGTSDDGAAILFSYTTKHFSMQAPQHIKNFRRLYFNINTTQPDAPFTVAVSVDFGRLTQTIANIAASGFNRWGEFVYGAAPYGGGLLQSCVAPLNSGVSGKYASLTLSSSDTNDLTIYSIGVQNKIHSIRGE